MELNLYSKKFTSYMTFRASHRVLRYLELFYPELRHLYIYVLMYLHDPIYESRKKIMFQELFHPAIILVYLTTHSGKVAYCRFPKMLVIRCLSELLSREYITDRRIKLGLAHSEIVKASTKIVRFHVNELWVNQYVLNFNFWYERWNWADYIYLVRNS